MHAATHGPIDRAGEKSYAYFDVPCNSKAFSTPVFNVSISFRSPSSDPATLSNTFASPLKIPACPFPTNSASPSGEEGEEDVYHACVEGALVGCLGAAVEVDVDCAARVDEAFANCGAYFTC
ncbi:hypothetical protein CY34DRAFT_133521 [Suillus luteus UH-Slu-Lm8-n1]|uniref:Uncharacterized protein n=1 Tax=Suillus luteus UH-Slu-Lm8-n1 TaxID=930992 RepID=A0A0D0AL97_9AGAM|nr:hypothetical protein CY34DRAFT_133521 [Suillus luteus UH-Slu-Lm8-n1]